MESPLQNGEGLAKQVTREQRPKGCEEAPCVRARVGRVSDRGMKSSKQVLENLK